MTAVCIKRIKTLDRVVGLRHQLRQESSAVADTHHLSTMPQIVEEKIALQIADNYQPESR
jgi:hypothetical protein